MEDAIDPAALAEEQQADFELSLVRDAVVLVSRGKASRVVVSGLSFGGRILAEAARLAEAAGVTAVALPAPDGQSIDIAVERD